MKRIAFFLMAIVAVTFVSCVTEEERDVVKKITQYEESEHTMDVYSIDVKQVAEDTNIYVSKVRYYHEFAGKTCPVFHVYKMDKKGNLEEMGDSDIKYYLVERYFHEAINVDDYVIVKSFYLWKSDGKVRDISYYIKKVKNERK